MVKRFMIGLLAAGLVAIFIAETANAAIGRYRRSVENFHQCSDQGDPCYGAESVTDRLFGAVKIEGVSTEAECDYYWDSVNNACYQPTCEMTGTVVCEKANDCGLLEGTPIVINQNSFQSEAGFTSDKEAVGISLLAPEVGVQACEGIGKYSDYKPDAIMGFTTYYKRNPTNSEPEAFYAFIDVCPDYQEDPLDPFIRDRFNCTVVWDTSTSAEPPVKLPCCGEPTTLTVKVTGGGGTVTSDDGNIDCVEGGENCEWKYGSEPPYDTCPKVTLTADADLGYELIEWSGTGVDCPGTGDCTVTPTTEVTATFGLQANILKVIVEGNVDGARVWIKDPRGDFDEPAQFYCTDECILDLSKFADQTEITMKRKGGTWLSWGGVCEGVPNSEDTCTITVDGDSKVAIAIFAP